MTAPVLPHLWVLEHDALRAPSGRRFARITSRDGAVRMVRALLREGLLGLDAPDLTAMRTETLWMFCEHIVTWAIDVDVDDEASVGAALAIALAVTRWELTWADAEPECMDA